MPYGVRGFLLTNGPDQPLDLYSYSYSHSVHPLDGQLGQPCRRGGKQTNERRAFVLLDAKRASVKYTTDSNIMSFTRFRTFASKCGVVARGYGLVVGHG